MAHLSRLLTTGSRQHPWVPAGADTPLVVLGGRVRFEDQFNRHRTHHMRQSSDVALPSEPKGADQSLRATVEGKQVEGVQDVRGRLDVNVRRTHQQFLPRVDALERIWAAGRLREDEALETAYRELAEARRANGAR